MKRMVAGIAVIILMFATPQAFGQQYIAVLICGDGPDASMQNKLESELLEEDKDRFAMWHDIFMMRRALVESGYQESDIYVLFKDGSDYYSSNPYYRGSIVTGNAESSTVYATLTTTIKNRMTENDVLFLYTFGHGNAIGQNAYLTLRDGDVSSGTFASWVNQIPCRKRIVVMAQCHSGAFASALIDGVHPTVALTGGTAFEETHVADNNAPDHSGELENDTLNQVAYYHSEFNYHVINAIRNRTITSSSPLSDLEIDGITGTSLSEIYAWAEDHNSLPYETPDHTDFFFGSHGIADISYIDVARDQAAYFTAPAAPGNVAVSGSVGQHPTVSWSANAESDLAGYKLYRKVTPDEQTFSLVATLGASQTSYTDPGVTVRTGGTGGQWVQYYVKAYDYVLNHSNASAMVTKAVNYMPQKANAGEPDVSQGVPSTFSLGLPFPNPFNPSTRIPFALPSDAHVRLTVTDVLGREVATITDANFTGGYHSVNWNAAGESSGNYFLHLEVTDAAGSAMYIDTAKLLLMK